MIEGTIRRNASPVRLEADQGGSCSSLASSTSDETVPRANRNSALMSSGSSTGATITSTGGINMSNNNNNNINIGGTTMTLNQFNQHVPSHSTPMQTNNMMAGANAISHHNISSTTGIGLNKSASGGQRQIGGHNMLLHSLSTNDASVGEYKYTVSVGHHNIKITGDCFELVRVN